MSDQQSQDQPVVRPQTDNHSDNDSPRLTTEALAARNRPTGDSAAGTRPSTNTWPTAAAAMLETDRNARAMGMTISNVVPGSAVVAITVRPEMLNGHAICHGGIIFMLADTAMAFASNAYGPVAVAAGASIEYLRPAKVGDRLNAVAIEAHRAGRNAIYDVSVTGTDGSVNAIFRGRTRIIADA